MSEGVWDRPIQILSYRQLVALPLSSRTKYISELRKFLVQQEQTQNHFKNLYGWAPAPSVWELLISEAVAQDAGGEVFPDPTTGNCRAIEAGRKYRRGVEYLISVHRDRCVIAGQVLCMALLPAEPHRLSCRLSDIQRYMPGAIEKLGKIPGLSEGCSGDKPIACQWPLFMRKDNSGPICKEARVGLTNICDKDENAKSSAEVAEVLKAEPSLARAYELSTAAIQSYCGNSSSELKDINGFDRTDCERLHARLAAVALPIVSAQTTEQAQPPPEPPASQLSARGTEPAIEIEISASRPAAVAPVPPPAVAAAPVPAPPPAPASAQPDQQPLDTCHVTENLKTGLPAFSYQVFKKADGTLKYRVTWGTDKSKRDWMRDGERSDFEKLDLAKPFEIEDLGDGAAALLDTRVKNGKGSYNRIQFPTAKDSPSGNYCWVIIANRFKGTLTEQNTCEILKPGPPPVTIRVPNLPSKADPRKVETTPLFGSGAERQLRIVPASYLNQDHLRMLSTLFDDDFSKSPSFRGAWEAKDKTCGVSLSRREMVASERAANLPPALVPGNTTTSGDTQRRPHRSSPGGT